MVNDSTIGSWTLNEVVDGSISVEVGVDYPSILRLPFHQHRLKAFIVFYRPVIHFYNAFRFVLQPEFRAASKCSNSRDLKFTCTMIVQSLQKNLNKKTKQRTQTFILKQCIRLSQIFRITIIVWYL